MSAALSPKPKGLDVHVELPRFPASERSAESTAISSEERSHADRKEEKTELSSMVKIGFVRESLPHCQPVHSSSGFPYPNVRKSNRILKTVMQGFSGIRQVHKNVIRAIR